MDVNIIMATTSPVGPYRPPSIYGTPPVLLRPRRIPPPYRPNLNGLSRRLDFSAPTVVPLQHIKLETCNITNDCMCSICFENDNIGALPCGHTFHSKCITTWFATSGNHTCPYCRSKVNII